MYREAWHGAIHGVAGLDMTWQLNNRETEQEDAVPERLY